MKIEKAIEILEELPDNLNNVLDYDQQNATKLGIEALKRLQHIKKLHLEGWRFQLPGETKD